MGDMLLEKGWLPCMRRLNKELPAKVLHILFATNDWTVIKLALANL